MQTLDVQLIKCWSGAFGRREETHKNGSVVPVGGWCCPSTAKLQFHISVELRW
jgi:hypothetical protein